MSNVKPPRLQDLLNLDGYLNPFAGEIIRRYQEFSKALTTIEEKCGGLDSFTRSYQQYGFNVLPDNSVHCLEVNIATHSFLMTTQQPNI